ncbi:MAG: thioredoxin family protein [Magnetococcales bacterium]|nr:thioredoxin family protein [Magnetococcales bacterium]
MHAPSASLKKILRDTPPHKLVFVIFSSKECFVCEKLRQHLPWFANANRENIQVMAVDVRKYPDLTIEYGVTGVPTILVFARERLILTEAGVDSKSQLKKLLKAALQAR